MPTKELTPELDVILAAKRYLLHERKAKTPIEAVRALASMQKRPQPVLSTITGNAPVMLIGQIKYIPAQTGLLTETYDPVASALAYSRAGVDAIALFTDETLYQRGLDDLVLVSRAVSVPVISQDYILDEYQVVETRAAGASALILYASVLDEPTLRSLVSATHRNRMTAIVEVTTPNELTYALSLSPYVIGIRGRTPGTPQIDFDRVRRLRALIPPDVRVMLTDGLKYLDDVRTVAALDVNAVIIREPILHNPDHLRQVETLLNRSSDPTD